MMREEREPTDLHEAAVYKGENSIEEVIVEPVPGQELLQQVPWLFLEICCVSLNLQQWLEESVDGQ